MKSWEVKHKPRKRFGQNFLIDAQVIAQILNAINPQPNDHVVEIGPGLGAITKHLLPKTARLDAIEIDRDLISALTSKFDHQGFRLFNADILQFHIASLQCGQKLRIVGNIPYNISTPLIFHLLTYDECISDMHLMVQKEVAARLTSNPGNKTYGKLSIMVQHCCIVTSLFDIAPTAFNPSPQVESTFIRLTPDPIKAATVRDKEILRSLTTLAFNQRRKAIRNALRTWPDNHGTSISEAMAAAGIEPTWRPEQLSVENYIKLSNILCPPT